jgi:hypothetical protein
MNRGNIFAEDVDEKESDMPNSRVILWMGLIRRLQLIVQK